MKVGAGLGGLYQANLHANTALRLQNVLACTDIYDRVMPGHPAFEFIRSYGISIGTTGWEYIIAVNQVGKRFHDEISTGAQRGAEAQYPPGSSGTKKPFTPCDWRNASVAQVRSSFAWGSGSDAALAMNEGSRAPDYSSGPVWAIFDQAAVDANGWKLRHPYIADPPNGTFFKADTIAELARLVVGNRFQRMPLKYLEQTVARFNGFVAAGKDTDFEKPTMHRIDKAPFYAALIPFAVNDSIGGLKIDGHCQVIDIYGKPIPGLFAGGEASGGGRAHGIGRVVSAGRVARRHAPPSAKALCGLVRKQPGRSIFRIRNLSMNGQEAVLFPVSLSLSISPQEADAGTALTLKAVAECPEQYDLSGDPVLFLDATGHEVGRAPLAALEGNDFGAEITVTAPIELGEYGYSIVLMPAADDGVAHAGAKAGARCTVKAHDVAPMVASSTAVPSLSVTSAVPSLPPADFPAQSGRGPARSNTPRFRLSRRST